MSSVSVSTIGTEFLSRNILLCNYSSNVQAHTSNKSVQNINVFNKMQVSIFITANSAQNIESLYTAITAE